MHTTAPAPAGPAVDIVPIRRVLVSVFDKTGLDRLAKALKAAGVRVASTGGTSTALASYGVGVEDVVAVHVADLTDCVADDLADVDRGLERLVA